MIRTAALLPLLPLLVAGCVTTTPTDPTRPEFPPLPESVVALAAPWQDLTTARLKPEDNCYWYQHVGQVETTLLPLRTPDGRPICAQLG
ncbi:MAG: hypothetical protein MUF74_04145 [Cypionkella sp.]|jgi:hypothetical protein|nr:hypothetical protein [Cypionkella sp.]